MIDEAVRVLRQGGVVAAATESFFGLLADAQNPRAIDALLSLKPRGADKGQPLMVPDTASWRATVGEVPPLAARFADAFWPGRMTVVLPALPGAVDVRVTLDGTVGVRMPGASPAARIVAAFGGPLTATSANPPGEPPAVTDDDISRAFPDAVVDGRLKVVKGVAPGGAVSSIVVVRGEHFHVVRAGAVTLEDLRHVAAAGL